MSIFIKFFKARVDITKIVAYSYQYEEQKQKPAVFLLLNNDPKRISLQCDTNEQVDKCVKQLDQLLNATNNEPDTIGLPVNPLWEHCQYVSIAELRLNEEKLNAANGRIAELEMMLSEIRSGEPLKAVVKGGTK